MSPLQTMFARLAQTQPTPAGTKLPPIQEMAYQRWKATLPQRLQYEGDYDLRGFYQKNPQFSVDTPGQHMTDEFKMPNHPTFSDESKYYGPSTARFGGHWTGDVFTPNNLSLKRRVDETGNSLPPDPRTRGIEPPFYSDLSAAFRSPVDRSAPPVMPFREPMQAGPAPPVDRATLAKLFGALRK